MNAGRGKWISAAARQGVALAKLITARLAVKANTEPVNRRRHPSRKPLLPCSPTLSREPAVK
jgi:hypothetical protein